MNRSGLCSHDTRVSAGPAVWSSVRFAACVVPRPARWWDTATVHGMRSKLELRDRTPDPQGWTPAAAQARGVSVPEP